MWGRWRGRGNALGLEIVASGALLVACGSLEQAGTGSIGAADDGGSAGTAGAEDVTSTSGGAADDDGVASGTGTGMTSGVDPSVGDGSSGSGPALDGTGSSGPGDGSSTGPGVMPMPGPHDGVYNGMYSATFTADQYVGACVGAMTLMVDETATPPITGSGSCTASVGPYMLDVVFDVEGTVTSPNADGTISATINFVPESTTWTGSFSGDTMSATFSGDFPQGPYTVYYTGSWSVSR